MVYPKITHKIRSCGAVGLVMFFALNLLHPEQTHGQNKIYARYLVEKFIAPELNGRGPAMGGYSGAAERVAAEFRSLGIAPYQGQGLNGYFQEFTMSVNLFPGNVLFSWGEKNFQAGLEFLPHPASSGGQKSLKVYYVDPDLPEKVKSIDKFLKKDWSGYAVVLDMDAPRSKDHLKMFLGLVQAKRLEPGALVLAQAGELVHGVDTGALHTPTFYLRKSRDWDRAKSMNFNLEARLQKDFPVKNVLGFIKGNRKPDSLILITAHIDHLGRLGSVYFPGANDNASGTAMMLDMARHYSRDEKPAYSMLFVGFNAEEAGLVGSSYMAEHPPFDPFRIKYLINLDLVGFGEEGATIVNGRGWPEWYNHFWEVNDEKGYLPSLESRANAANSDHYPFTQLGVRAFFIYLRGGSPAYHSPKDDHVSLDGYEGLFKLITTVVRETP